MASGGNAASGYAALVAAVQEQVAWLEGQQAGLPISGRHDKQSGLAFTANLPASQKPLRADILTPIDRKTRFGNDCDLFAFCEATLGAGRGWWRLVNT